MSSSGFQSLSKPIDPRSLSFSLAFVYLALCVVCSVQLGRIAHRRHRLLSFGPVFIVLAFLWTLVRSVQLFLAKVLDAHVWAEQAWDVAPYMLEFATFSLLAMYFAHVLLQEDDKWEARRPLVLTVFIGCNMFVAVLNVLVLALYVQTNAAVLPVWLSQMQLSVEALMWLIVVGVLGGTGAVIVRKIGTPGSRVLMLLPKGTTRVKLAVLLCIICVAYLSRIVFSFVNIATERFFTIHNGVSADEIVVCVLLLSWEILPLSAVLLLFGSVAGSRGRHEPILGAPAISINNDSNAGGGGGAGNGIRIGADGSSGKVDGTHSAEALPGESDPLLGAPAAAFFKKDTRYDSDSDEDPRADYAVAASPYRPFSTGSPQIGYNRTVSGKLQ